MLLKKKYKKNIKKDVKNKTEAVRKIDYALGAVLDISSKPVEKDMEDND